MLTAVEVFNRLRTKIGEEEAKILVEFVQETVEKGAATKEDLNLATEGLERRIDQAATKEDLRLVKEDLRLVKEELKEDIHQLERRIDRILYVIILLFVIFNGDRIITILSILWKLTGKG